MTRGTKRMLGFFAVAGSSLYIVINVLVVLSSVLLTGFAGCLGIPTH